MYTDTERPKPLSVVGENIPQELKELRQWVCWSYQFRDDEWKKPPFRANGRDHASSTDPSTWGSFDSVIATYDDNAVDGICFALSEEDDFVGIDLDDCFHRETNTGKPFATEIIQKFRSYTEFSPSKTGIRILVRGKLPDGVCGRKKGDVEVYFSKRFLSITGHALKNCPLKIKKRQREIDWLLKKYFPAKPKSNPNLNGHDSSWEPSDVELLDKAFVARDGSKLRKLFDGEIDDYNSNSEADFALCSILAFWTQDPEQIDRVYRRSNLFRDKWDSPRGDSTYGADTIEKALAGKTEHYSGPSKFVNSYSYGDQPKIELAPEALHGLLGEIVGAIEPYSEGDRVAITTNIVTGFANLVGHAPYARVEETFHHLNLYVVQVGITSKGRKGTAWSTPRRMFRDIDPEWADKRITSGVSSGEGIVFNVRDPRTQTKPVRKEGKVVGYEDILIDKGEDDKRLFLIEEELGQLLKVMGREHNIVSPILRQAWDHGNLRTLTKNDPNRATDAHISIIGHVTRDELLRHLVQTEQTNGFANRFCWFLVSRSKEISRPTGVPPEYLNPLIEKLREAVEFSRTVNEIVRDDQANAEWDTVYHDLSEPKPGLTGALIARGEAQVLRFSCVYALLDKSAVIRAEHQRAALALWEYSEQSVKSIFGDLSGDPNVDVVREALKAKGELTLTEVHALFGRNATASEVNRVVGVLIKRGEAKVETVHSGKGSKPITRLRWARNTN